MFIQLTSVEANNEDDGNPFGYDSNSYNEIIVNTDHIIRIEFSEENLTELTFIDSRVIYINESLEDVWNKLET